MSKVRHSVPNQAQCAILSHLFSGCECNLAQSEDLSCRRRERPYNATVKISFITSVFKSAKYLPYYVRDANRMAGLSNHEIIIVHPQNSPEYAKESEILKGLSETLSVTVLSPESDPGLYACWNLAINEASGDYLSNWNTDDRKSPFFVKVFESAVRQFPEADLLYGKTLITKDFSQDFGATQLNTIYPWLTHSLENLFLNNSPHCMPVWKKSLHDNYGQFDTRWDVCADGDMWLRAAIGGANIQAIDEIVGLYYENPNGISTNPEKLQRSVAQVHAMRRENREKMVCSEEDGEVSSCLHSFINVRIVN